MSQPPQPPAPPPPWQPTPPPQPARQPKAPLLLGILIGAVAPWFGVLAAVLFSDRVDAAGLAPVPWFLLVFLVGCGLLFPASTRRWGLGILIGMFAMLIIGAGACVVIFVALVSATGG